MAVDIGRRCNDQCNHAKQRKQYTPHFMRARCEVADVALGVQAPLKPLLAFVFNESRTRPAVFALVVHKQNGAHDETSDGTNKEYVALVHQGANAPFLM
jgi:hypothetical protein